MLPAREDTVDFEVVDCLSCCQEAICAAEFIVIMFSEMAAVGCAMVSLTEVLIYTSLYQNTTHYITLDTKTL